MSWYDEGSKHGEPDIVIQLNWEDFYEIMKKLGFDDGDEEAFNDKLTKMFEKELNCTAGIDWMD